MIPVFLGQIAADSGGHIVEPGSEDLMITSVTTDSRNLAGGELFVAIAGERVDGHVYAADALKAGAAAVLVDDLAAAEATGADRTRLIVVDSTLDALGNIAREALSRLRREGRSDFRVVGVTGSVGKTTTKDLLATILALRGPIIAPPGSFNNEIGLPLTVLRATEETATLVLEMGADHIGNLAYLTSIAPLDVGVVLTVARAHVGEFGGIENVARAKSELVQGILPTGTAILNADDARVAAMAPLAPAVRFVSRTVTPITARGPVPHVWTENVSVNDEGIASFDLVTGTPTEQQSAPVTLGLIGAHHVANAVAAAGVGIELGLDVVEVAQALSGARAASPHRMDVWRSGGHVFIDDAYNANPDSMRAGISALAQLAGERQTLAVLGSMLELGDVSDDEHRAIGDELVASGIRACVLVGDETRALADAARAGGLEVHQAQSLDDAELAITDALERGPHAVLFKGSNGAKVWELADRLREATAC